MNRTERRLQKLGQPTAEMQARAAALLQVAMRFHQTGQHEDAAMAYRDVIAAESDMADAWCNYGNVLAQLYHYDASLDASQRAIDLNPMIPDSYNNIGSVLLRLARADEAFANFTEANRLAPTKWAFAANVLSSALYVSELSLDKLNKLRQRVCAPFNQNPDRSLSFQARRPIDRIRIGYLSSDLRDHVVSNILLPVVKRLDPAKFELFFYSNNPTNDHVTEEYNRYASLIVPINDLPDQEVAAGIRNNRIDILVSVSGALDYNRPTVCAHRAAPVQISMHDAATSGLRAMDVIVTDEYVDPASNRGEWFSEPITWFINPFYMIDRLAGYPPLQETRTPGPPVFGCFNNPAKISTACLAAWREIMARVPSAMLTLSYENSYAYPPLRERILNALDVGEERVTFYADRAPRDEFLSRYNGVDIALDTFPFSGSTTSFQAMAMGVNIVTFAGDHLISRLTSAMQDELKIERCYDRSVGGYVFAAVDAAQNVNGYWRLRGQLRRMLEKSPICDADAYTAKVAEMFETLVKR